MSVKSSANRFPVDALTVFRNPGLAAVTATTSSAVLPLDVMTAYWYAPGESAVHLEFAVELQVEAAPAGTVVLNVDVAAVTDTAFATPVTIASLPVTAAGTFTLPLTKEQVTAAYGNAGFIRVNAVLSGSTPSVAFNAYLSPLLG